MKKQLVILFGSLLMFSCNKDQLIVAQGLSVRDSLANNEFIKGVSFVASREEVNSSHLKKMKELNANFIALMPFALGINGEPTLRFDDDYQWWGETVEGVNQTIKLAREQNQKIMIKPQIWFRGGLYTGHFELGSEKEWQLFEENYSRYILKFAEVAQQSNAELFCIGTELETFVSKRPEYWKNLIKEVREVYKGKLTYAANWDAYKKTWIWQDLDYIGVDAYFPLTNQKNVTLDSARYVWNYWVSEMREVAERFNKKVILTEWGYRSIDFAAKEPWRSDNENRTRNDNNQVVLYKSMFQEVWSQDFIAGGFVWKWFPHLQKLERSTDIGYTPQFKAAEEELRYQYSIVHTLSK